MPAQETVVVVKVNKLYVALVAANSCVVSMLSFLPTMRVHCVFRESTLLLARAKHNRYQHDFPSI